MKYIINASLFFYKNSQITERFIMDQGKKALLAIVLIIVAGGIFAWNFTSGKKKPTEEAQSVVLETPTAKALEAIFKKLGTKKWTDSSLWSNSGASSKFGAAAERLFTAKPSMDQVKILDYGSDKQNGDAPFLVLQVPGSEYLIQVDFKETKPGQLVMDSIIESQIKPADYKKH